MELGSTFDDSLFLETKTRNDLAQETYHAKLCQDKWFHHVGNELGEAEERSAVWKFRAEEAYRCGDHQRSLDSYTKALESLAANNTTTWRDIQDGRVRCLLDLGLHGDALQLSILLHEKSSTPEQRTASYQLLSHVYGRLCMLKELLDVLQQLVTLHPQYPQYWLQLADVYQNLSVSGEGATPPIACHRTETKDAPQSTRTKDRGVCEATVACSNELHVPRDQKCEKLPREEGKLITGFHNLSGNSGEVTNRPVSAITSPIALESNAIGEVAALDSRNDDMSLDKEKYIHQEKEEDNGPLRSGHQASGDGTMKSKELNHLIEETHSLSVSDSPSENTESLHRSNAKRSLLIVLCCLLRAKFLLRVVHRTTHSFAKERNEALQKQVEARISALNISEEDRNLCSQQAFSDEEGSDSIKDAEKDFKDPTAMDFESKWFPGL